MRSILLLLLAAAGLLFSVPLRADPLELARSKQCLTCHAIQLRTYGPSFQEIAARHAADPNIGLLVRKIKTGGKQHWGEIAMPASGTLATPLTDDEAITLARWILSLK